MPLTLPAARPLNVQLPGGSVAAARGMRVNATWTVLFSLGARPVAAAFSVMGAVGYLGLVDPHVARWPAAPDHAPEKPSVHSISSGCTLPCIFPETLFAKHGFEVHYSPYAL